MPRKHKEMPEEIICSLEKSKAVISENRLVVGGIEFVRVPAGKFIMGSKEDNPLAHDDDKPQHTVELLEYWMARFPLTNEQYAAYIGKEKHPIEGWEKKKDHPAVKVSWNDAITYCQWFNQTYQWDLKQVGNLALRLPTEAEWEKAARGEFGNEWPWGNEWDASKCNSREGSPGTTTPVGAYSPAGDSPYGCADMVGNVWEWTHTLLKEYPYKPDDGREHPSAYGDRVDRGGSLYDDRRYARCAYRNFGMPSFLYDLLGFRVVASPVYPVK